MLRSLSFLFFCLRVRSVSFGCGRTCAQFGRQASVGQGQELTDSGARKQSRVRRNAPYSHAAAFGVRVRALRGKSRLEPQPEILPPVGTTAADDEGAAGRKEVGLRIG